MFGLAIMVLFGSAGLLAAALLALRAAVPWRPRVAAGLAVAGVVLVAALAWSTAYIWGPDEVWAATAVPYALAIAVLAAAVPPLLRPHRPAAHPTAGGDAAARSGGSAAGRGTVGGVGRRVRGTAAAAGMLAAAGFAVGANRPPVSGQLGVIAAAVIGAFLVLRPRPVAAPGTGARTGRVALGVAGVVVALVALAGWRTVASRLPATYAVGGHAHSGGVPVTSLVAPASTAPVRDVRVTALAAGSRWRLEPAELRVRVGDRLRVTLVNRLPEATALHWHGVPVPGSQDGVPGLTQDAVRPGASFTYTFDAVEPGSYWYHAHQDSLRQVARGLYGALVVEPAGGVPEPVDRAVLLHTFGNDGLTVADPAGGASAPAAPGQRVRLRVVNTDDDPHVVTVAGAPFQVAALDGHDLRGPTDLLGTPVTVPAGGRADLTYTQPAGRAQLRADDAPGYATGSGAAPPAPAAAAAFDLTGYGTPDPSAVPAGTPDVRFTATVTTRIGWYDGRFGARNEINGKLFPHGDMITVREGQLVEVTIVNRSFLVHPMHLHGHTFTVVSSGGRVVRGSPVRLDTVNVEPGTSTTIVFRADNPGLWMFHCHNLIHASAGMDLMVGYAGVGTPFLSGSASGNDPE